MTVSLPIRTATHDVPDGRHTIRYIAAAASVATAVLYFGIGFGVLNVVDEVSGTAPDMFDFGVFAGLAFVLGASLLLAVDRRALWILGAILQVGVIVMYVAVAPQRTPAFETWGIIIKLFQVAILVALIELVVRAPARASGR